MAETSTLGGILDFFVRLGVYEVVLPFLLVFTIVFAILEKTRVLGTEEVSHGGHKQKLTKKNLNSMVAFCVAFFVILSREIVATIHETMANVFVLLLVIVSFLMLVGAFQKESDAPTFLDGTWKKIFMVIMFISVILIFLHAIPSGDSNWLEVSFAWLADHWNEEAVAALIFVLAVALFMWWMARPPNSGEHKKDEHKPASGGNAHH